jgi:hypothetical protein
VGAADRIAETILKMGQIRAEGLQHAADAQARAQANSAQIWGGALQSLGQIPGEVAKYKLADTENQVRQAQLAEHQKQQNDQFNANQIFQFTTRPDPDGTVKLDDTKFNAMMQKAQGANIDLETQSRMSNAFKQMNADGDTFRQQQLAHQVKVAQNVMSMVKPGERLEPGVALATLKLGQANGWATAQDTEQFLSAINQGHDPADIFKAIIQNGTKPLDPIEAAKLANEERTGRKLEAEIPGIQATSQKAQAVTAGMQGGLTADQVADNARQAAAAAATEAARVEAAKREDARLGLDRQRVGMEGQRLGLDQQKFKASQAGAAPSAGMAVPDVASGQKNDAFIETLPAPVASQVKALAEGRMAFPQGAALRSDYWQNMLQNVAKYDPSFDAVNYNARSKTRADFTSGKAAQQVNAINTVIGHLSGLSDAAEALNNSDIPLFNSLANSISKATGSPKVTNFDTIKKAVSDEVTRVWRQSGGSEADIQAAQKNLDASGSPAQLRGAIATYADLLESKLGSLNEQYRQGMGTDKIDMITPGAQKALDAIEKRAGRAPAAGAGRVVVGGIPFPNQAAADKALADWNAKQGQK